jgi:hypothetical protein
VQIQGDLPKRKYGRRHHVGNVSILKVGMEQITNGPPSSETAQRRKAADYVYQAATVVAALLLLLTATV